MRLQRAKRPSAGGVVVTGRGDEAPRQQMCETACEGSSRFPGSSRENSPVAGKSILVIEDDASVRSLLQKALSAKGYAVQLVADGLEALTTLETVRPDLMIVDIMMPRLDGMTFVKAIKGNERTNSVPVIFLTAKNDPSSMIAGINLGAKYYVTKPFALDELLSKVAKALGEA